MLFQRLEQKRNPSGPQRRLPQPLRSHQPVSPTTPGHFGNLCSAWIVKSGLALQRSELELSGFRAHERPELPESAEAVGKPADEKCAERQKPAQAQVRKDFRPLPTCGGEGRGGEAEWVGGWVGGLRGRLWS